MRSVCVRRQSRQLGAREDIRLAAANASTKWLSAVKTASHRHSRNCWSMCTMRRSIMWLTIGTPLALVAVAAGATAAVPTLRHIASGLLNTPDRLPALPDNRQVHYQHGADDYARVVSAMLPSAIARIEAAHGRPFAHPVPVGVYATPDAYEAANGLGSSRPVGVTFFGRVNLSPGLYARQRQRIPAILTHELSHARLQGWIGGIAYIHLPNWFNWRLWCRGARAPNWSAKRKREPQFNAESTSPSTMLGA